MTTPNTNPGASRTAAATAARLAKAAARKAAAETVVPVPTEAAALSASPPQATGESVSAMARPAMLDETPGDSQLSLLDRLAEGGDVPADTVPARVMTPDYVIPRKVADEMRAAMPAQGEGGSTTVHVHAPPALHPGIIYHETPIPLGSAGSLAPVKAPTNEIKFEPLGAKPEFLSPRAYTTHEDPGIPYSSKTLVAFVDSVIADAFRQTLKGNKVDVAPFIGMDVIAYGEDKPPVVVGQPRYNGLMVQKWTPDHAKFLNPNAWHKWFEELRILSNGRLRTF